MIIMNMIWWWWWVADDISQPQSNMLRHWSTVRTWRDFEVGNNQTVTHWVLHTVIESPISYSAPMAYLLHIGILLPSGKLTSLWTITILNGKIHSKWPFSIVILNYQRVHLVNGSWTISHLGPPFWNWIRGTWNASGLRRMRWTSIWTFRSIATFD